MEDYTYSSLKLDNYIAPDEQVTGCVKRRGFGKTCRLFPLDFGCSHEIEMQDMQGDLEQALSVETRDYVGFYPYFAERRRIFRCSRTIRTLFLAVIFLTALLCAYLFTIWYVEDGSRLVSHWLYPDNQTPLNLVDGIKYVFNH